MAQRVSTGHEVSLMTKEWLENMEKEQTGYKQGMLKLLPEGWLIPTAYLNFEKRIYNFEFKSSDVVLMTMPKSGTTWTQEILWTMMHNPNLDNPKAKTDIMSRSPQIDLDMLFDSKVDISVNPDNDPPDFIKEFFTLCPGKKIEDGIFIQMLDFLPDPRLIKTHLPLALLPPNLLDKSKVVYVARNPKDVMVSMCHHFRLLKIHNYSGTLDNFVNLFMNDDLLYSPYWPHVKLAWEKRNHPNLHFMFFEDMKADIKTELQKLNDFIGTGLSQEQLDNIAQYTSFSAMKKRNEEMLADDEMIMNAEIVKAEGGFFRKGETGDWKNNFSPELAEKMNKWIEEHASEIGITFK